MVQGQINRQMEQSGKYRDTPTHLICDKSSLSVQLREDGVFNTRWVNLMPYIKNKFNLGFTSQQI